MALYAAHLPLDLHAEYGNNMRLARLLGLRRLRKFGRYHGITIGWSGVLAGATGISSVAAALNRKLGTRCVVHGFGKKRIRTIGIVSGGGGGMVIDAADRKIDCFLTGEIDLASYNAARELGVGLIAAGHYATETVGVKALMALIAKTFGVKTVFIEDRKPL